MSIDYQSQASATPASGTSITITKPAGTADGDILIAQISAKGASTPTITPPSGWTSRGGFPTAPSTKTEVFTKIAGASEPTDYTWTTSIAIVESVGVIARYAPVAPSSPPGVIDAAASQAIATTTAPSVTATGNNDRLVVLFSQATPGTTPSGFTQRFLNDQGSAVAAIYDKQLTSAGATGDVVWPSAGGNGGGWQIALYDQVVGNKIRMMI